MDSEASKRLSESFQPCPPGALTGPSELSTVGGENSIGSNRFCPPCGQTKPLSAFSRSRRDGWSYRCKECNRKQCLNWREKNLEKVRAKDRLRAQQNKEKNNARARQWQIDNKDGRRLKSRAYRLENRDRIDAYVKAWKRDNRGRVLEAAAFRKQRIRQATPPWLSKAQRKEIQAVYTESVRLSDETGIPHHVDHETPLVGKNVCGLHVPWNLQILPAFLNLKKSNHHS